VDRVKRSSFEFAYEIWHEEDKRLIAEGRTVQVIVDLQTMRPIRIPKEMRAAMATALGP
jgi:acyl-CoA thioesterase FadM